MVRSWLIFVFLFPRALFSQDLGGVMDPLVSKEFSVIDCFNKPGLSGKFKPDSVKANYMLRGFKVWRAIALDNKQNSVLFNSGNKCVKVGLCEIIKFGLFEKKLNAFSSDDFNEAAKCVMSKEELLKAMVIKDSVEVTKYDANGNGAAQTEVVSHYFSGTDIKGYLLKEDWVLNSYSGKMEKYVIGLAPLVYNRKQEKVLPLFWLYYREWEELLASFEAKNFYSYDKISYKDVFQKKYFISVISKENNLFNRSIKDYRRGEEAWFESERVKEKMVNSESDLFQH